MTFEKFKEVMTLDEFLYQLGYANMTETKKEVENVAKDMYEKYSRYLDEKKRNIEHNSR